MAIDFAKLLAAEKAKTPAVQPTPASQESKSSEAVSLIGDTAVIKSSETVPAAIPPLADLGLTNNPAEPGTIIDYPGLHDLRDKVYSLDAALKVKHPAMDSLLQTIHRNLQKDPELIHLLKPEERAMIFAGLKQKTQTVIVTETVKSAGGGKNKGLKNISIEDL